MAESTARAGERESTEAALASVGDRMASLVLKGLPKLDELERLATRWQRLRRG